jgi:hypothetical protein
MSDKSGYLLLQANSGLLSVIGVVTSSPGVKGQVEEQPIITSLEGGIHLIFSQWFNTRMNGWNRKVSG